jgi:hypothetical protein
MNRILLRVQESGPLAPMTFPYVLHPKASLKVPKCKYELVTITHKNLETGLMNHNRHFNFFILLTIWGCYSDLAVDRIFVFWMFRYRFWSTLCFCTDVIKFFKPLALREWRTVVSPTNVAVLLLVYLEGGMEGVALML